MEKHAIFIFWLRLIKHTIVLIYMKKNHSTLSWRPLVWKWMNLYTWSSKYALFKKFFFFKLNVFMYMCIYSWILLHLLTGKHAESPSGSDRLWYNLLWLFVFNSTWLQKRPFEDISKYVECWHRHFGITENLDVRSFWFKTKIPFIWLWSGRKVFKFSPWKQTSRLVLLQKI